MANHLKQIVVLSSVLFLLISCGSPKPAVTQNNIQKISITETLHDTVFKIEKDSSFYSALLECQNGKIILKNVTQAEPGRTLKSPKVRLDNNKLSVDCELKEQELYAFWKSRQIKDTEVKTITTTQLINQLTFWQKMQIWLGRIFIIVLGYYVIKLLRKFYRPF